MFWKFNVYFFIWHIFHFYLYKHLKIEYFSLNLKITVHSFLFGELHSIVYFYWSEFTFTDPYFSSFLFMCLTILVWAFLFCIVSVEPIHHLVTKCLFLGFPCLLGHLGVKKKKGARMLNFGIWKEERELHKLNSTPYKYRNTRMKCCFHFVFVFALSFPSHCT